MITEKEKMQKTICGTLMLQLPSKRPLKINAELKNTVNTSQLDHSFSTESRKTGLFKMAVGGEIVWVKMLEYIEKTDGLVVPS